MPNATRAEKPRTVHLAVVLIWFSIAVDAMATVAGSDGQSTDVMLINLGVLLVYAVVNGLVSQGRHWARVVYSVLVACEVALLLAFGLDGATDLDVLVTALTLPLETCSLVMLFGASADAWFAPPAAE